MKSIIFVTLMAGLVWVSSCSPQPIKSRSVSQEVSSIDQEAYSVSHAMGKTTIPATPQRVIVLTNESTDHVLALGLTPVGAVQSWLGDPYYDYIADEMQQVPVVGEELQPSLEQIAALNPDLIIGSNVRHAQIYNQLSAIAPTVFSETLGADWQENLRLYGQALNREAEAAQLLANWEQRVADFQSQMGNRVQQEVSLVRFLPGVARVYYNDNFAGRILNEIGFQRPPAQQKDQFADEIGYEQISLMEGDVLFYMTFDQGEGEASQTEQAWTTHPLWQNLDVVQANQVYEVNDVYWNTAGGVLAANRMLDDLYRIFLDQPDIPKAEEPMS